MRGSGCFILSAGVALFRFRSGGGGIERVRLVCGL